MPPAEELDSADLRTGDSRSVESCQELLGTDEGTLAGKISPGIPVFTLFCTGQRWSHADACRAVSEGSTVPHGARQSI